MLCGQRVCNVHKPYEFSSDFIGGEGRREGSRGHIQGLQRSPQPVTGSDAVAPTGGCKEDCTCPNRLVKDNATSCCIHWRILASSKSRVHSVLYMCALYAITMVCYELWVPLCLKATQLDFCVCRNIQCLYLTANPLLVFSCLSCSLSDITVRFSTI